MRIFALHLCYKVSRKEEKIEATSISTKASDDVLINLIIDSIQDIKGKNIIQLDLRKLDTSPADYFIICEGESSTQVQSIAQNVNKRVKQELGIYPSHTEGVKDSRWVLVDYFGLVVHVFYPETRAYYDLENLWHDARIVSYEDV